MLSTAGSYTNCQQPVLDSNDETPKSIASEAAAVFSGTVTTISANGPQMAAAAFNSAASVTENMTHLGIKNFSYLGLFFVCYLVKPCF